MDENDIRYVCMLSLGKRRLIVSPTGSGVIGNTKKDFFEKFKAALTEDVEISVRDLRITFRTIFYPKCYYWLDFPIIRGPIYVPLNVYPCDIV